MKSYGSTHSMSVFVMFLTFNMLLLCGCMRTGLLDLPLFVEKFNELEENDAQIDIDKLLIHEKTYYYFFPADGGGEYLFTMCEDEDTEICEYGICVVESIDVNTDFVSSLFSAGLYAMCNTPPEESKKVFDSLKLNDVATYKEATSFKESLSNICIEVIVNEAGTGIYVYRDSK